VATGQGDKVTDDGRKRTAIGGEVDIAKGAQHHQTCGMRAAGGGGNKIRSSRVRPVNILQDEQEGGGLSEQIKELQDFAQASAGTCRPAIGEETLAFAGRKQRGKLGGPSGGVGGELSREVRHVQAADCLQDCIIRFLNPSDTNTAADGDQVVPGVRQTAGEGLNQGGLAYARLAGDEHGLCLSATCRAKTALHPAKFNFSSEETGHGQQIVRLGVP
jgi:hypothetical protein